MDLTQASILFFSLGVLLNLGTSYVTWRATGTRATKWWAISAFLALFALLFIAIHTVFPWRFLLLFQNIAYSVALAMVPAGIRFFRGQKYSPTGDIVFISVAITGLAFSMWQRESFTARVAIGSMIFAYYSFSAALSLWQCRTSVGAIRVFSVTAWSLFGLINVLRLVMTLAGIGIDDNKPFAGITYLLVFIFGPICTSGGYTGLVLLVVQRLLDEKHEALRSAERLAEEYRQLSDHDPLTNALNNRSFARNLELEMARSAREKHPLSVVMADLDHFKLVNDTFGHAIGDEVLKQAVTIWRSQLRAPDLLGRVGGEEFVIILPNAGLRHAADVAERLRSALELGTAASPRRITASFGVTEIRSGETIEEILRRVDVAMYAAKQKGRNRVEQA